MYTHTDGTVYTIDMLYALADKVDKTQEDKAILNRYTQTVAYPLYNKLRGLLPVKKCRKARPQQVVEAIEALTPHTRASLERTTGYDSDTLVLTALFLADYVSIVR